MTTFVTPTSLQVRFDPVLLTKLTDQATPRTGAPVPAVLQAACDRAESEVAAYVSMRYPLPLASVPLLLAAAAEDLALAGLYQSDAPQWVKDNRDAARKLLRDVRDGTVQLGLDQAGAPVQSAAVDLPEMVPGQKAWGRESAAPYGGRW